MGIFDPLVINKADNILGCSRQSIAGRSREVMFPLCSVLVRSHLEHWVQLCVPTTQKTWTYWRESSGVQQVDIKPRAALLVGKAESWDWKLTVVPSRIECRNWTSKDAILPQSASPPPAALLFICYPFHLFSNVFYGELPCLIPRFCSWNLLGSKGTMQEREHKCAQFAKGTWNICHRWDG